MKGFYVQKIVYESIFEEISSVNNRFQSMYYGHFNITVFFQNSYKSHSFFYSKKNECDFLKNN